MPNIDAFLGWSGKAADLLNAGDGMPHPTDYIIGSRETQIVIIRGKTTPPLDPQTVHFASMDARPFPYAQTGDIGFPGSQRYVVIGDETLDIKKGDRFALYDNFWFTVILVDDTMPGKVEAYVLGQQ